MRDTFVGREIARNTRNSLLAHAVFLLILAGHVMELWPPIAERLARPYPLTSELVVKAIVSGGPVRVRVWVTPTVLVPAGDQVR